MNIVLHMASNMGGWVHSWVKLCQITKYKVKYSPHRNNSIPFQHISFAEIVYRICGWVGGWMHGWVDGC